MHHSSLLCYNIWIVIFMFKFENVLEQLGLIKMLNLLALVSFFYKSMDVVLFYFYQQLCTFELFEILTWPNSTWS